jgi:hypothetical protein
VVSGPASRRPLLAVLGALAVAALTAGCVSMPGGGAVKSYTITQGPGSQSQPFPQIDPNPPGNDWTPEQIVQGFLTASASFANAQQVAREYLTPEESRAWTPNWSAVVFSNDPTVRSAPYLPASRPNQATVTVTGTVQANLSGFGSYAVPSAKAQEGQQPFTFELVKSKSTGQWRISQAPKPLLLTGDLFNYDYQLRNLYFFDPSDRFLVPDPVYVPKRATPADLMDGLVHDLITPPGDWLSSGATKTAFPAGTKPVGDVTLDGGTAAVNLGGAIAKASAKASPQATTMLEQVSAQLWWTLTGSGQGGPAVQSVEVSVDNKPWPPPNSDENPVQHQVLYSPPTGTSNVFYYLDGAGNLWSQNGIQAKPVKVARVGTGYSQIAVSPRSPNGQYVAALRGGSLFIGPLGGKLSKREGTGYTAMSWDPAGNLWATTNSQIVMLLGAASPRQPAGLPVAVSGGNAGDIGSFTGIRVAPDGVRVAIIAGSTLKFGAIVSQPAQPGQPGGRTGPPAINIVPSPFSVTAAPGTTFSAVTWYGPDNVITLGNPGPTGSSGPTLTEYPVDGGTSTSIPAEPHIRSITASSFGSPLIAGLAGGGIAADASLNGSWLPVPGTTADVSPAYPG